MSPVTTSDGGAKQLVGTNKERWISSSIVVGAVVIVVVLARSTPRSCARSMRLGRRLLEILGSRSFVFFVSGGSYHTSWSFFVSVAGGVTVYSGIFPGLQSSSVVTPSS